MSTAAPIAEPTPPGPAADAPPAAPSPPRRAGRTRVLLVLATLLALGTVGIVVAVVVSGGGARRGETREIVIPLGTADRLRKGQQISLLPPVLQLHVGDRLIIRNRDEAIHYAGPYTIRPGEVFDVTYDREGIYPGPCTVNPKGETSIVVS